MRLTKRLFLAPLIIFALALLFGGPPAAPKAHAAITVLPAGVTCTEFYLDIADVPPGPGGSDPNDGIKDDLNGDTVINSDDITEIAISRLEPAKSGSGFPSGTYAITSVIYPGPDTSVDAETLIPNEKPDQGCAAARTEATGGTEVSQTNPRVEYVNQFGTRPSNVPVTLAGKVTTARTCGFSEAVGTWIRQDSFTTIASTGPTSINSVDAVLYLATDPPTEGGESGTVPGNPNLAVNPLNCGSASAFPYTTVGDSYGRSARTDDTTLPNNIANSIVADPSGTGLGDTADGLQDDYDGDGCTDWDELDKNFSQPPDYSAPASANQRGMDPFNPNDCDQNVNGNISLIVQVGKDNSATSCTLIQIITSTCVGDGAYFHCLADVDHTKSGSPQPVTFNFACYSDSIASVVNTNYDSMNMPETVCTGAVDEDMDGGINDGCPESGTNGEESVCTGNADDDGDGRVNDGCPASGAAEGSAPALANIGQCYNGTDDDGDTVVNDGCTEINAETGAQCNNALDDDVPASNDSLVNDGCGTPSECTPLGVADPIYCGDGRAGPAPPDTNRFAAPSDANWPSVVAGSLNTGSKQISVGGCFEGLGGQIFGPNVFADGSIDLRTGVGTMTLHGHINNLADCQNGLPFPSQGPVLDILGQVDMAQLGNKAAKHDSDFDGCTDSEELAAAPGDEAFGGLRDPFNRWDFYDAALSDGTIDLFNDIFGVAFDFGTAGSEATDRAAPIPGGNVWNLPKGDGTVDLFNDIFGVAFQFGHTCTGGGGPPPPTPPPPTNTPPPPPPTNTPPPPTPTPTNSPTPLDVGGLGVIGNTAIIRDGEQVRWVCDPGGPSTPATLRFAYTWGDADVNGTGLTTVTQNPPVQLESVECLANGSTQISQIDVDVVLIDPSGTVFDAISSAPIPGATVSLEYNDGGTWRALDPNNAGDQARMEPDINPEATGLTGRYAWDVAPGQYRVQVSKSGCTSNTGGPVTVPPPETNLNVGITCSDPDGDGLPSFFETTSAGGTHTNPNNPDTDGDTTPDGNEDCDGDSLTNLVEVLTTGTDPCSSDNLDSDLDGCTNIEELGSNEELGGRRDSSNFWDFYDVWTHPGGDPGAGWERDQIVGLFSDIFAVASRFGAVGDPFTDPLTLPSSDTGYHPDFDRSPPGADPWDVGRGDGTIDLFNDIFGVGYQAGHDCTA